MAKAGVDTLGRAIGLHQAGRIGEALRLFESILAADPRNPAALQHVAIIHANRGDFAGAEGLFRRALAIDPLSAENHSNLGRILTALNQHQRAVDSLRQALALRPGMVEAEFNLGALHLKLGQREQGMACLRRALERRPDFSEALCLLAGAMNERGDGAQALTLLREAIARRPQDASLHHALGRILTDRGEFAQARSCFEAAIDRSPGWGVPYYELSLIHRFAPGDPRLAAMKRLLQDPGQLSLEGRIGLHMALYKANADAGAFDAAFSYLRAGNAVRRAAVRYDEAAALGRHEAIRQIFNARYLGGRLGRGHASPVPIFVVGFPRSGTTLIEQILASHPAVHGAGELPYVGELTRWRARPEAGGGSYPGSFAGAEPAEFAAMGAAYCERLSRLAPAAERIVDKMPGNYLHLGLIHLMLPQARIVHVRRDAMDTCFSCFENDFGERQAFSYDLGELGRRYAAYRTVMAHWREVLPAGAMIEIDYEDVVGDVRAQVARLLQFCRLPWDERCLNFHEIGRAVFTHSQAQVRRPLYSSSIGRWKMFERHLDPLAEALQAN